MRYSRILLRVFKSRYLKRKGILINSENRSRVEEIEFRLDSTWETSDLDVMTLEEILIEESYLTRDLLPRLRKLAHKTSAGEIGLLLGLDP
jgi:hypothetical protein